MFYYVHVIYKNVCVKPVHVHVWYKWTCVATFMYCTYCTLAMLWNPKNRNYAPVKWKTTWNKPQEQKLRSMGKNESNGWTTRARRIKINQKYRKKRLNVKSTRYNFYNLSCTPIHLYHAHFFLLFSFFTLSFSSFPLLSFFFSPFLSSFSSLIAAMLSKS